MSLESELRDALHAQLDTVLDAARDEDGRKVIHDLIEEAERGMVISVSVHTMPKPEEPPPAQSFNETMARLLADDDVPAGP